MRDIVVIGAGGHAKVVADIIVSNKALKLIGFADKDKEPLSSFYGSEIIGNDSAIKEKGIKYSLANGIGFLPSRKPENNSRKHVFNNFKKNGFSFPYLIHPNAYISSTAKLSEGAQIMSGVKIQSESIIGINSIINTGASIDHDCVVGNHVHIAPGVVICGEVNIGDDCFIGAGAVLLPNVKVDSNTIIPAGEIVRSG